MSRHECRTVEGALVVVGWDPPLQTFFGQVYTPEDAASDEGGPSVWVGALERLASVEDLIDALGEWGPAVSGATRLQLVQDKDGNTA